MKVNIGKFPKNPNTARKISIKVDEWDSWNADSTIAMVAHPVLVQLKDKSPSFGFIDDEDVPAELGIRSTDCESSEKEFDYDSNALARWNWFLDEIIWTMNEIANAHPTEDSFYDHSNVNEKDHLMKQVKDIKVDEEGLRNYRNRLQKGCELFGKYFQTLWS
jgi:hypothetical protein